MSILENVRIAINSVRSNWVRAILTLLIIAIGIMSLVGILTAVDSIAATISNDFSSIGANVFNIERSGDGFRRHGRQSKMGPYITYREATEFKQKYNFPSIVAISLEGTDLGTVKYKGKDSNPNVTVKGGDESYLALDGYEIEEGRYFTKTEAESGRTITVIGQDILSSLFEGNASKAIGENINIGSINYKIVGVLAKKGSGFDNRSDRTVIIPLMNAKMVYGIKNRSYNVAVSVREASDLEAAIAAAMPVFRNIRKIKIGKEEDFKISKSDGLLDMLEEQQGYLRIAAIVIGIITLLGASVGLMNIMLVTVTERTREIGVRKSLGATSNNILTQFLVEAILICQLGGLLGVFLGILAGNGVASAANGTFIVPWNWIFLSVLICLVVGLASGLYPALKAAKLDPIESLRYE